jgi:hypothetical protein
MQNNDDVKKIAQDIVKEYMEELRLVMGETLRRNDFTRLASESKDVNSDGKSLSDTIFERSQTTFLTDERQLYSIVEKHMKNIDKDTCKKIADDIKQPLQELCYKINTHSISENQTILLTSTDKKTRDPVIESFNKQWKECINNIITGRQENTKKSMQALEEAFITSLVSQTKTQKTTPSATRTNSPTIKDTEDPSTKSFQERQAMFGGNRTIAATSTTKTAPSVTKPQTNQHQTIGKHTAEIVRNEEPTRTSVQDRIKQLEKGSHTKDIRNEQSSKKNTRGL